MPTDEPTRFRLHRRLSELLEPDLADAMMESMPPLPWDQLATKADITALEPRFDAIDRRFAEVDRRFAAVDERFDLLTAHIDGRLESLEGRLSLRWMETTRMIVLALLVLFVGFAGLAIRLGG